VLAVDDRHVAFCKYNDSVVRIICVAVATLANEKHLERASDFPEWDPDNVISTEKATGNNQFDLLFKIILDIIHRSNHCL
jgi:hypothetical protein